MKKWLAALAASIAVACASIPASAQWQVPDHTVPIGNGAGVTGFSSAGPGSAGECLISNGASSDPSFQACSSAAGAVNTFTANHTIDTADCGNVVQAGTGATGFFTVTLPAVSGFPTTCEVTVVNSDTARGKLLSGFPNSLATTILWPRQAITVKIVNGAWNILRFPGRWQTTQIITMQVNHASGTASNIDCLSTGAAACATIGQAVDIIQRQWDCRSGSNPTIQVASATFTENVFILGHGCIGSLTINIRGDTATPSNAVWQCSTICLATRDHAIVDVRGFRFTGTSTSQIAISAANFAVVDHASNEYHTFTSGYHLFCDSGGTIASSGNYSVTGNMSNHMALSSWCQINCLSAAVSVPNALTFSAWASVNAGGSVQATCTYSGTGSAAGSTGLKYTVNYNGVLTLFGATLPGASAGTTATGGQVQ